MSLTNNLINYVEFKTTDIEATKAFYNSVFGWTFTNYGPSYVAFSNSGLEGGFELTDAPITSNSPLIVLYHKDLKAIQKSILEHEGLVTKDIFAFPGGCRFHFSDPSGNELAVWSDQ
jgi:predicted enzyme related to lactoylglutathione lyase